MPNVMFSDALLLLNAGGWYLDGGYAGKGGSSRTEVSRASLQGDLFAFGCDGVLRQSRVDGTHAAVIGKGRPREIHIMGPITVRQERKRIHGGGWHEVEQTGLLFRFIHKEADAKWRAARAKKHEEALRQNRDKRRAEHGEALRRADEEENRQRSIVLTRSAGETVKCFILDCDWKERIALEEISNAIRRVFDGRCPSVIDVPDTGCSSYGGVISSSPITSEEAQTAWEMYVSALSH